MYVGGAGVARGYLRPPGADRASASCPIRSTPRRGAALPDRRPGALAAPTATLEYLGPARPPGEDPRVPHRARRDRGRHARPRRASARRRHRREDAPATSGWWRTSSAIARCRRCVSAVARQLPDTWCLAPSFVLRRAARSPRTARWTAGAALPRGGAHRRGAAVRRAPHLDRGGPRRESGRRAGGRAGGRPRQLLRARRPLAAGRAARRPRQQDVRGGSSPGCDLRGADHQPAGGAGRGGARRCVGVCGVRRRRALDIASRTIGAGAAPGRRHTAHPGPRGRWRRQLSI